MNSNWVEYSVNWIKCSVPNSKKVKHEQQQTWRFYSTMVETSITIYINQEGGNIHLNRSVYDIRILRNSKAKYKCLYLKSHDGHFNKSWKTLEQIFKVRTESKNAKDYIIKKLRIKLSGMIEKIRKIYNAWNERDRKMRRN